MNKKCFKKSIAGAVLALSMTSINPGMTFGGGLGSDNRPNDDLQHELAKTQNDLDKQKAKTDELEKKVNDLANRLETEKEPEKVTAAPASLEFPIHGYFVGNYVDSSQKEVNGTFDQATLHLYLDYPLSETFIFHGDVGFNHGAEFSIDSIGTDVTGTGDVDVTEAWLDWKAANEHLILKFGKFYTPFGVWTPKERPYMTPSVWDPLLTRWALHSRTTTGIQAYGVCDPEFMQCSYALYVGNGHGERPQSQDDNTDKVLGGRLGIDFNITKEENDKVGLGISGQTERDGLSLDNFQRKTWGFDAKISLANFTLRGETSKSRLNEPFHLLSNVWFGQLSYRFFEKFEVYYRYDDAYDNTRPQNETIESVTEEVIQSGGVAYWPIEQVVFKTGYSRVEIQNKNDDDYRVVDFQTAVRF